MLGLDHRIWGRTCLPSGTHFEGTRWLSVPERALLWSYLGAAKASQCGLSYVQVGIREVA